MTDKPHSQHHFRFYVLLTTLVLGGVLLVLLINNNSSDLTGMASGVSLLEKGKDTLTTTVDDWNTEDQTVDNTEDQASTTSTNSKYNANVDIDLTFDQVPEVGANERTKIKEFTVKFRDFNTKIYVNNDRLELNNMEEVTLELDGFDGAFAFDEGGLTIDGTAKKLIVNGMTLSSKGSLKISFKKLGYEEFEISDIELKSGLVFPRGDGELKVSEKLTYELEMEQVDMDYFQGSIIADSERVSAQGVTHQIKVSGALLNLNLN